MTASSGRVSETLWDDGEFVLSRGVWNGESSPLLAVAPTSAHPSPRTLARLQHAYTLREELDPAWAARPSRLEPRKGRLTLLIEDPGGEPLLKLLGRPWEIGSFLRLAIGAATALAQVHRRGLIHKDIKPANVLVNTVTGQVWLMGFGIASRLPRERQALAPPEVIAGTLAYMAPEQTGRMNRSIDFRSDLYALGVTLYEMLTGELPFTASDPMEWVHCHVARQPRPPDERVAGIPGMLSGIVMKLLAKTAEDRYQTTAGLTVDLRKCLAQWESHRSIEPFPLGEQDASDRLLIPERLYGRKREIETLLGAFDRVVANGATELVLVSGYSGIGKTSVVNELHKALVPPRGLFASGKFDQYKRDIPYATLAQAFQSLVRPLLGQSEAALGRWRAVLQDALGPNGQLITNLVPELAFVIGEQPPVADLPPHDSQNRFQMVFRRFLGVFARKEHPLALFLDDLQWLDSATLDLLEHLVTHPEVRHLLLVGAYRHNEVVPTHLLLRTLEAIRQAGAKVHEIALAPLSPDDIGRLVADTLCCNLNPHSDRRERQSRWRGHRPDPHPRQESPAAEGPVGDQRSDPRGDRTHPRRSGEERRFGADAIRGRLAAHSRRSGSTAASDPQLGHQRRAGDGWRQRGATGIACHHRASRIGRRSGRGPGYGSGAVSIERRASLRCLLHDEARRNGDGAVDLPFDRGGARRTNVGQREPAPRRHLSIHRARRSRCLIEIATQRDDGHSGSTQHVHPDFDFV